MISKNLSLAIDKMEILSTPGGICPELLEYAEGEGIRSGSVFHPRREAYRPQHCDGGYPAPVHHGLRSGEERQLALPAQVVSDHPVRH